MNLRNVEKYSIGLDVGTGSVGWATLDDRGDIPHVNGKPAWGSRLLPEAQKAADARVARGQRRRYDRRRQRIELLQGLFCEEMAKVDSGFFVRLNQSRLVPDDRGFKHVLFAESDEAEKEYYQRFPTVYHLRAWLMAADEAADIRFIYLAFHNIVKHRGNFLQQDAPNLTSQNADVSSSVERLCDALLDWCDAHGVDCTVRENVLPIEDVLRKTAASKTSLKNELVPLLGVQEGDTLDKKRAKDLRTALAGAVVGCKAELANVFFAFEDVPEGAATSIYLSNDEHVEAFRDICPDDGIALFEAMCRVYSSFVLQEILSLVPGGSISANKIAEYDRYGQDLETLKRLVRNHIPDRYDELFRGAFYDGTHIYNRETAKGYTKYNSVHGRGSYDEFRKELEKAFSGSGAENDPAYQKMMEDFAGGRFLRRLKTSDNGSIPYQLHLEEMRAIIANQAKHYPFLQEEAHKLESLVHFRIPYYVGPLTVKNARRKGDAEDGDLRFAWSVRKEGKENEKIYPWNWEEVIDKNASAEAFIRRMTGMCTYLQGESVLPRASLLYEEYCALNELNGARWSCDGDDEPRFDYADRADMMEELFKKGRVTYKKAADWMSKKHGHPHVRVMGGQGELGFESKLSSYIFFCKDVFKIDELSEQDYPMVEEIILWSTLFEDRDILKEKLQEKYGDRLDAAQIKTICRKRFSGWGRLSEKLLTGVKVSTDNGPMSIMDVLREGNPTNGQRSRTMVLMEILHDENLGFGEKIDEINKERLRAGGKIALDELPGSPALRRGINQALRIVDEIVHVAGRAPEAIYVEVARSDEWSKRGSRTKKRYDALKEALKKFKEEAPHFWDADLERDFKGLTNKDLDERLTLYFMQGGKSLYSMRPLVLGELANYQVDHILPQSYIKDDSLENKALVLPSENQRKSDQMLLDSNMRREMKGYWDALHEAGLIGDKKYRNLLRDKVSEKQLKGFIARQLVETSQIVKTIQLFLQDKYPDTDVLPIKAALSHDLREQAGFVKCREANDYHHAHDALLACEIGRFVRIRHPKMFDNPLACSHAVRNYLKQESRQVKRGHAPGSASFVIASFMRSGFDSDTGEIIRDTWNADAELGKIRKFLNYRQCYVTRMPEETSGAFWKQTIYSPRNTSFKDKHLALKKGLDPNTYGFYTEEKFAYFFIYRGVKKKKPFMDLAPVPVSVAATLASDPNALVEYAKGIAEANDVEFEGIVRPKILKYQLMEIDGSRLYLTGKKEARNAVQIAFTLEEMAIFKALVDGDEVPREEVMKVFEAEKRSLLKYSPRLSKLLKIGIWDESLKMAAQSTQASVLAFLASIASWKTNKGDLTAVGGSKLSGNIQPCYSKELSTTGITLIDQSVTGMFERREFIGL